MPSRSRRPSLLAEDRTARTFVGAAIACDVLATAALLAGLALIARVIATVFVDGRTLAGSTTLLLVALGCFATRAGTATGADLLAAQASRRVRDAVRADLLGRLVTAGRTRHGHTTGELATVLADRVDALDAYVTQYLRAAAMCALGPALVFVVIGIFDPLCLIVLTFTGPMLVLLLAVIGARTRKLSEARAAELGWLHAFFLDMVRGLGTLKAYGRADDGAATIASVSRRHGNAAMEVLRTAFQTSLVMEWAATAATALVAVIVSLRLINDQLAFTTALTVLVLTPEFFLPFRRLALAYHSGSDGKAALATITELRAELGGADDGVDDGVGDGAEMDLTLVDAQIALDRVTTRYPGAPDTTIGPFTLRIEPGETVALVGPSGSGKTTVTRLLLGLVDPTGGTITIGGRPLSEVDIRSWRSQIAWVPQDPLIIAASVADNVRLGAPDASLEAVTEALRAADATAFVAALPDGAHTLLDEGGRNLSAGQRQRIAIARAFLRDAPIVILDEFTAHLDADTEASVLGAAQRLLAGRTALVISHHDAAHTLADRIVTLHAEVPA